MFEIIEAVVGGALHEQHLSNATKSHTYASQTKANASNSNNLCTCTPHSHVSTHAKLQTQAQVFTLAYHASTPSVQTSNFEFANCKCFDVFKPMNAKRAAPTRHMFPNSSSNHASLFPTGALGYLSEECQANPHLQACTAYTSRIDPSPGKSARAAPSLQCSQPFATWQDLT